MVSRSLAWCGKAGKARWGKVGFSMAWQGKAGKA